MVPPALESQAMLLRTSRTYLRRLGPNYVDLLVELDSDPEVMRYITGGQGTSRKQVIAKLGRWTRDYESARPGGFWAAHLLDSNEFIGWVHLKPDGRETGVDELGYRLKRSAWGQGLATELASAMIHHSMVVWRAKTVVGYCLAGNTRSRHVMKKCGMRLDYEFVYPEEVISGLPPDERRAVRYKIDILSDHIPDTAP